MLQGRTQVSRVQSKPKNCQTRPEFPERSPCSHSFIPVLPKDHHVPLQPGCWTSSSRAGCNAGPRQPRAQRPFSGSPPKVVESPMLKPGDPGAAGPRRGLGLALLSR